MNGTVTIFHFDQRGQLIAESNASGTVTAEYVYLNDEPLAKIEGVNVYYYHNDHLGTPQKMTDSTGTVVWAADYKPFGEATITVSTITNNLRFPGQYYDAETGLNYNYYRDYNPAIGRYLTWDPVLMVTGDPRIPYLLNFILNEPLKLNPYLYVANDPVNWVDIFGLEQCKDNGKDKDKGKDKDVKCPPGLESICISPLFNCCNKGTCPNNGFLKCGMPKIKGQKHPSSTTYGPAKG